jgi:hypothetical protein
MRREGVRTGPPKDWIGRVTAGALQSRIDRCDPSDGSGRARSWRLAHPASSSNHDLLRFFDVLADVVLRNEALSR